MKGIILAGGAGTRLHPLTLITSKQLLPIHDKPMIYYPISTLMLAGIRDILIITTPKDVENFKLLLGDGSQFGLNFSYEIQTQPRGLAEAFIIGESFIDEDDVCLILGDNLFYGHGLSKLLKSAFNNVTTQNRATIFGYSVNNPKDFGIAEISSNGKVISLFEKPKKPKSNIAVTGLYFYPNDVIKIANKVRPSKRGELEITSINNQYLKIGKLDLINLGRGFTWLDTGTHSALSSATQFVNIIEKQQSQKIACLEEIAFRKGWLEKSFISNMILDKAGDYYDYLKKILI
tara:strand:- start:1707 stop:2576 length:870 start_codon:yes stop_codon:yes gene_type:complete